MSDIKIEHVKIKIGDSHVELTMEQAKSLKDELDTLFPEPVWKTIPQPYPVPANPWWTEPRWYPVYPTITCGGIGTIGAGACHIQ